MSLRLPRNLSNSEVPLTSIEPESVPLEVIRSEVSSGESVVPPGVCPTIGSVPPEVVHSEGSSVEFMDVDPVSVDSDGLVEFPPVVSVEDPLQVEPLVLPPSLVEGSVPVSV